MYEAAKALRQRGAKVYLTTPGALPVGFDDSGVCGNCGGCGTLYLEYPVGGPYDNPPAHKPGTDSDGKVIAPAEHPSWIESQNKWYSMTMTGFPCVVCQGGAQNVNAAVMELVL